MVGRLRSATELAIFSQKSAVNMLLYLTFTYIN